ncbi:dTDP-4-dehydrorhamnose reductase [Synechococcus sp. BS55D]|uniref:dTDP-4-dehydrorhamnose reductase n=1 Tax=Synechococcus sp. BS55D TaxID=2055943 RepID=UPI00103F24F5|nr:dTDP-4-dehydrorhamnose reductase [Synechococcus sp. BS55D]TCD58103.1 dTDP-4-dehydrorhamnose reductase [Synechococcus sp. BS55D]
MKVLLTGSTGQLGQALLASRPMQIDGEPLELIATARCKDLAQAQALELLPLDLADPEACRAAIATNRPDWVLNAGAYTAVDRAESEPVLARAVNAGAPRAFAEALSELCPSARLLQISTDFVFNGEQGHPYRPEQPLAPLGVYGASKAAAEQAVRQILGCSPEGSATILRTSWVYGPAGKNFLLTMLRLHGQRAVSGEPLRVVADQVGCPTSTAGLALACWAVIQRQIGGVLHWSDAGAASWYDFAVAIGELAVAAGVLECAAPVEPITTADYPTPARRPPYSLLDCSSSRQHLGLQPRHWRDALREVIADVGH